MSSITIYGCTFDFTDEMLEEYIEYIESTEYAEQTSSNIRIAYRDAETLDKAPLALIAAKKKYYPEIARKYLQRLRNNHIMGYDYSVDDFLANLYTGNECLLDSLILSIGNSLGGFRKEQVVHELMNDYRTSSRPKVVGGGFGLAGAATGIATAGVINLGTGVASEMINMVDNFFNEIAVENKKDKVYHEGFKAVDYAVSVDIAKMRFIYYQLCNHAVCFTAKRLKQSQNIIKAIESDEVPVQDLPAQAVNAIQLYPTNWSMYAILWEKLHDDNGELVNFLHFLRNDNLANNISAKQRKYQGEQSLFGENIERIKSRINRILTNLEYLKIIDSSLSIQGDIHTLIESLYKFAVKNESNVKKYLFLMHNQPSNSNCTLKFDQEEEPLLFYYDSAYKNQMLFTDKTLYTNASGYHKIPYEYIQDFTTTYGFSLNIYIDGFGNDDPIFPHSSYGNGSANHMRNMLRIIIIILNEKRQRELALSLPESPYKSILIEAFRCYTSVDFHEQSRAIQLFQECINLGCKDPLINKIVAKDKKDEQKRENSSGCFITSAVCESFHKPDDCYELTMFRSFRDNWLIKQSDGCALIQEYYKVAPVIVRNINQCNNAAEIYKDIWNTYLAICLQAIKLNNYERCKKTYVSMVRQLCKEFYDM